MTPTKDISGSSTNSPFMRYAVLATLVLTVFVITSFVFNVKNLDSQAIYLATEEAGTKWNKDQAFRRWATRHGGLYAKPNERTQPNPYPSHWQFRDVETTDGVKLTLMNPNLVYITGSGHDHHLGNPNRLLFKDTSS